MNLPQLKDILTDPDEFLSNAQLKSLALEILALIPMDGIEGSGLDPEEIMEVVLRAAVGTTSINGVTTKTSETPNRKTVMDWLHTLEKPAMLDAVNDILALVAMTVLDPPRSRTVCIDFMDNPFHGHPEDEDEFRRMKARDGTTKCHRYCTAFVIVRGKPLTLAIESVAGEDSKADAVERVLARVETYPFETERILIDRAAFVGELIGVLRETAPPVFPVKTGKDSLRTRLSVNASYMTEETICEGKEHEQTYPLAVNVTYQNGDRGKHGVKRTGYAAYGLEDRTPALVALGIFVGYVVGQLVEFGFARSALLARYKTAIGVLVVVTYFLFVTTRIEAVFALPIDAIGMVPLAWFADLALAFAPGVAVTWPRIIGAIITVGGGVPVLGMISIRLAGWRWYADPIQLDADEVATTEEPSSSLRLMGWLSGIVSRPTLSVARKNCPSSLVSWEVPSIEAADEAESADAESASFSAGKSRWFIAHPHGLNRPVRFLSGRYRLSP